jgi:hypothetical protein
MRRFGFQFFILVMFLLIGLSVAAASPARIVSLAHR